MNVHFVNKNTKKNRESQEKIGKTKFGRNFGLEIPGWVSP
jgi:hypothetical protein